LVSCPKKNLATLVFIGILKGGTFKEIKRNTDHYTKQVNPPDVERSTGKEGLSDFSLLILSRNL
jgi:hypothetical protein